MHPLHFDFVLGVQMSATIRDLVFMAGSVPAGSTWTATGLGKNAWHIAAAAISMGGHVRVGFEDNLYLEKGVLAQSNGQMVEKVVQLAKLLGREIASPAEAREILGSSSTEIKECRQPRESKRLFSCFCHGKRGNFNG